MMMITKLILKLDLDNYHFAKSDNYMYDVNMLFILQLSDLTGLLDSFHTHTVQSCSLTVLPLFPTVENAPSAIHQCHPVAVGYSLGPSRLHYGPNKSEIKPQMIY